MMCYSLYKWIPISVINLEKEVLNTIYEIMAGEMKRLDQEITKLQKQLDQLPNGMLYITRNHTRYKWYIKDGKQLTYLPKDQKPLAKDLAMRKYISISLEELIHEKQAIQFCLKHHAKYSGNAEKLLLNPAYHSLLSSYFQIPVPELQHWRDENYEHNCNYPEQLIHRSASGNMVRSKSESFIDSSLYKNNVPYRYECALHLENQTFFPDFTILHPKTKQIYYWEHFGMMDHPDYSKNTYSKLQIYTSNKIIPGINLITTFETKEHPLCIDLVDQIINYYFL